MKIYSQEKINVIPYPKNVQFLDGKFNLNENIKLEGDETSFEFQYLLKILKTEVDFKGLRGDNKKSASNTIILKVDKNKHQNSDYQLEIQKNKISIISATKEGLFHGIQTLVQLIKTNRNGEIACLKIEDEPKFAWRGMHLDVCRHFFTVEEVKQYIDYLAMYKLNTFHWHLTDDQGWRIEIKKYPKLTELGAKRNNSMIGAYSDNTYDGKAYGPYFYTQNQIKEVVKYATERHITVVPEIEMPGHALAALAAYPELACTKGPFEVATKWGVFDDVFCPKDETFTFLENVLSEVIGLFPSQYIHIGGDECPKTRWKECPHCQELIKKYNLKDEHGLQSYFIQRIEKFVNKKGRKIIGWDEILEGGLAPNAAVMSWTGEKGGAEAAKSQHFAVMTPGAFCYFDHYQGDPQTEPNAFGGFTPLEKVYSYNPIPKEVSAKDEKYILGVQANLWTEYILDFSQVQYMIFPRLMALSEVGWGTSNTSNYKDFENRVISHFKILDQLKINYAKTIYNIEGKVVLQKSGIAYELSTSQNKNGIRYTTDGSLPTENSLVYDKPIFIDKSMVLKSGYFNNNQLEGKISAQNFVISKSSGKSIVLQNLPHENYSFGGAFSLVDGILGNSRQLGKSWLGFNGEDVVATIDFGKKEWYSEVFFNTLENKGSWIHYAKSATIFASDDNKNFKLIKEISAQEILNSNGKMNVKLPNQSSRYLKVVIENAGIIPTGNPGANSKAWLFVDEIGVN